MWSVSGIGGCVCEFIAPRTRNVNVQWFPHPRIDAIRTYRNFSVNILQEITIFAQLNFFRYSYICRYTVAAVF
jgi:hypothetical protein